jgi:hypothetical protein
MFKEIINRVLEHHDEFSYEEIEEICQDYYNEIPKKIKEETKLKRVNKYITSEFELDSFLKIEKSDNKEYNLDTIPKYLFE